MDEWWLPLDSNCRTELARQIIGLAEILLDTARASGIWSH
jgi:hypothetical protein